MQPKGHRASREGIVATHFKLKRVDGVGGSLLPNRMRFATMWKYYFDDSFQGATDYSKPQDVSKILTFVNKIMPNDTHQNRLKLISMHYYYY